MKEMNSFLMTDSESELIRRPMSEILNEVKLHFEDGFDKAYKDGGLSTVTPRLAHASILEAEGRRLYERHPEYGRKLIVASIFWQKMSGLDVLSEEEMKLMPGLAHNRSEKRRMLIWWHPWIKDLHIPALECMY